MVEDHAGLNNERISETRLSRPVRDRLARARDDDAPRAGRCSTKGFFYCLFDTPDRIQHLFWRFTEPDHPANRGVAPSARFRPSRSTTAYRRCDAIVGKALELATTTRSLIALSDHGFNSFRRGVHLNTWLYDNGFLALRDGCAGQAKPPATCCGRSTGDAHKAYAVGLGGIYLNVKGREEQGIVPAEEAEAINAALVQGLTGLVDPERGNAVAIHRAQPREAVYHGPYLEEAPDILVDFAPGYRISWSSSMGGVAEGQFEDNVKKWSGDHIIDPDHVPGVLFMNRPFRAREGRGYWTWPRRFWLPWACPRVRRWKETRYCHENTCSRPRLRGP